MAGLAFTSGVLSFTSPFCLPLMPGHLAYISSAGKEEAHDVRGSIVAIRGTSRAQRMRSAVLLVLGFGTVFTTLGAGSSALRRALLGQPPSSHTHRRGRRHPHGAAGDRGRKGAGADARVWTSRVSSSARSAPPSARHGVCHRIGALHRTVLAGILTLAPSNGSVGRGAALLAIYSVGLALPFIGLAVAASRLDPVIRWPRRHARLVKLSGGAVMIVIWILFLTYQMAAVVCPGDRAVQSVRLAADLTRNYG